MVAWKDSRMVKATTLQFMFLLIEGSTPIGAYIHFIDFVCINQSFSSIPDRIQTKGCLLTDQTPQLPRPRGQKRFQSKNIGRLDINQRPIQTNLNVIASLMKIRTVQLGVEYLKICPQDGSFHRVYLVAMCILFSMTVFSIFFLSFIQDSLCLG